MKVKPVSTSFVVASEKEILSTFKKQIAEINRRQKTPLFAGQLLNDLIVAFTEGVANAIRHGGELKTNKKISCRIKLTAKQIELQIMDHGPGFNLKKIPLPNFQSMDESGRGLFMIRQLMDSIDYSCGKKRNVLILKRLLIGNDPQTRALDLLYEISDAILGTADIQSVYTIILDRALDVFQVERASILIYDKNLKKLKVVASRGLTPQVRDAIQVQPGEGIAGYVYQHAKPCLIADMRKNSSGWEQKKHYKSQSFISAPMICSPMRLGQESIGVINMTDRIDGRSFTRKDLQLLTTIANQATAYLHMYRLLSDAKDAEIMRRELDIARQIQRSYLPQNFPSVHGIEMAGWCEMAQSVGGDYYDFIEKDGQNFYVVIADVAGHNVAAALTMANFRSLLRTLLSKEEDPGKIITLINQNLFNDLAKNDQFISMVLVHYRPTDRTFSLANAGHRFPLLIDRTGHCFSDRQEGGTVLGVLPHEVYSTISVELSPGDSLVLYTDGLTEITNDRDEAFGLEKLQKIAEASSHQPVSSFLKKLHSEMKTFLGDCPLTDDATVVALRRA